RRHAGVHPPIGDYSPDEWTKSRAVTRALALQRTVAMRIATMSLVTALLSACVVGEELPKEGLAPTVPGDVFMTLKAAPSGHAELCDHDPADATFPDQADRITDRFCQDAKPGGVIPEPHGLVELLTLLNLDFKNPTGGNGADGNPAFAILGHSSALTA